MNIVFTGRKVKIKESFKEQVEKKLKKLERFFGNDVVVNIEVTVEKKYQKVEITVLNKGFIFRSEKEMPEMEDAFDAAASILFRQIVKNKTKLERKGFKDLPQEDYEDVLEEDDFIVIKTKKFTVKPMNIEEAILQMNQLGHSFFVFLNSDNEKINIVYKRKDENYAILEPEML